MGVLDMGEMGCKVSTGIRKDRGDIFSVVEKFYRVLLSLRMLLLLSSQPLYDSSVYSNLQPLRA